MLIGTQTRYLDLVRILEWECVLIGRWKPRDAIHYALTHTQKIIGFSALATTEIVDGQILGAVAAHPRLHFHKVRHEAGYVALQDGRVAFDHILGHHFGFVVLIDDFNEQNGNRVAY